MPSNVLPLHLMQTFPPIIWIFTEGLGGGIESRLPLKIFSTLRIALFKACQENDRKHQNSQKAAKVKKYSELCKNYNIDLCFHFIFEMGLILFHVEGQKVVIFRMSLEFSSLW